MSHKNGILGVYNDRSHEFIKLPSGIIELPTKDWLNRYANGFHLALKSPNGQIEPYLKKEVDLRVVPKSIWLSDVN